MARSAADAAVILDAMAGYERSDPASVRGRTSIPYGAPRSSSVRPAQARRRDCKHGSGATTPGVRTGVNAVTAALEAPGFEIDEVVVDGWGSAVDADFIILGVEASVYHEDTLARTPELYGDGVRAKLEWGCTLDGMSYVKARLAAQGFRKTLETLLSPRDILICPSRPCPARSPT